MSKIFSVIWNKKRYIFYNLEDAKNLLKENELDFSLIEELPAYDEILKSRNKSCSERDALHTQLAEALELLELCYNELSQNGLRRDGPILTKLNEFLKEKK